MTGGFSASAFSPQVAHDRLIARLQDRFGDRLFVQNGVHYALIFFPVSDSRQPLDSVLHVEPPQSITTRTDYAIYDDAHLNSRIASRTMTDDLTFTMARLDHNPLRLHGGMARYFDMIATCDALDHELRDFARGDRDDTPQRDRFFAHIRPEDALMNGRGRAATVGVAVLTVFNTPDGYQALLARRDDRLATGAGLYHVLPAFVFQPLGPQAWWSGEWSLEYQIMREFGEELFAMPEYATHKNAGDSRYFHDFAPVAELRAMLVDGRASLFLTGVAFNLLSMRPEICALLVIHDADWRERNRSALEAAQHTERQSTHHIPVTTLNGLPDDLHLHMAPQGAAAFWMGLTGMK